MISITCPCGRTLRVPESRAGSRIRCSECGGTVEVPKAKSRTQPAAASSQAKSDAQPSSPQSNPQPSANQSTPTKKKPRFLDGPPAVTRKKKSAPSPPVRVPVPTAKAEEGAAANAGEAKEQKIEAKPGEKSPPKFTPPKVPLPAAAQKQQKQPPEKQSPEKQSPETQKSETSQQTAKDKSSPEQPIAKKPGQPGSQPTSSSSPSRPKPPPLPRERKSASSTEVVASSGAETKAKPVSPPTPPPPPAPPTKSSTKSPAKSPTASDPVTARQDASPPKEPALPDFAGSQAVAEPPVLVTGAKETTTSTASSNSNSEPAESTPAMAGVYYEPAQLLPVYLFALGLIALALLQLVPAIQEIRVSLATEEQIVISRWVWPVFFLAALQLIYAIYLAQLPDWSSVWVVAIGMLMLTMMYAALQIVMLLSQADNELIQMLELQSALQGGKAKPWCILLLLTHGIFTYLAGHISVRWHRKYRAHWQPS